MRRIWRDTLTNVQLKKLQLACEPKLWLFVVFGVLTGARIGVIKRIRWRNLEGDNDGNVWLRIRTEGNLRNKSGRQQNVPMHPYLVKLLSIYRNGAPDEEPVFPAPCGGQVYSHKTAWKNARRKAEVEKVTYHGLRRTFGTMLSRQGISLPSVQRLMDHASIRQTRDYIETDEGDLLKGIRGLDSTVTVFETSEKKVENFGHHLVTIDEKTA